MSKEKIIDKIKKCLALGNSPNANEASVAKRQAKMLMLKHGISMDEVFSSPKGESWSVSDLNRAYEEARAFYLPFLKRYVNVKASKAVLDTMDPVINTLNDIVTFKKSQMFSLKSLVTLRTVRLSKEVHKLEQIEAECNLINQKLDKLYFLYFLPRKIQASTMLREGTQAMESFINAYLSKDAYFKHPRYSSASLFINNELTPLRKAELDSVLSRLETHDLDIEKCLEQAKSLKTRVYSYLKDI